MSTFIVGGVHTLLWLPRAFQMRRELRAEEAREAAEERAAAEEGDHHGINNISWNSSRSR